MKRADKHMDACEDDDCKFCHVVDGLQRCCFGMRNNYGCIATDPEVQERCNELMGIVSTSVRVGADTDSMDLINRRKDKVFNFIFKGHEYTASDSARNQSTCPHCEYHNLSGRMFDKDSEGVLFIGTKDFGNHTAECFECGSCFKRFFFHL